MDGSLGTLELYTLREVSGFAEACGYSREPFTWGEDRRARLTSELDAAFFRLYRLTREDAAYALDTFPIVKSRDEAPFGDYRSKRTILEDYERLGTAEVAARGE
jgi:hypothetical protein